jgi:hypothetical protein
VAARKQKHCKRETRFVSLLTVYVPDAQALIDMMRYDSCYPASELESHKICALLGGRACPVDHIVRLVRVAHNDLPATEGRWRSFACRVLDERSPDGEPLSEDVFKSFVEASQA